jgi:CRP-like cAMP-binding protein
MANKNVPINPVVSRYMAALARRRHARLTPQERAAAASQAGRAYWAALSKEERSAEMKRRRRLGIRRKRQK